MIFLHVFLNNVFLNKILLIVINYVNSYDFSTLWQTRRNVQLKDQTQFETILERYILLSNCVLYIFPPPLSSTEIVNCQVFEKRRTDETRLNPISRMKEMSLINQKAYDCGELCSFHLEERHHIRRPC